VIVFREKKVISAIPEKKRSGNFPILRKIPLFTGEAYRGRALRERKERERIIVHSGRAKRDPEEKKALSSLMKGGVLQARGAGRPV